uniref:Transmembrane protein 164 n=1 Tax=Ciona intestinalis TaxID=7719 RepID=F6XV81_CIOIN|nr:transmembrane protein 164 [Ciona intestinalis]|eukprot:XP_002129750.1 transmembrane protein 164 [Ciona intestinalis]
MLDWLYSGVDFTLDGNGGTECAQYLSLQHRVYETILVVFVSVVEIIVAIKYIRNKPLHKQVKDNFYALNVAKTESNGTAQKHVVVLQPRAALKSFLLVALCLAFGIEIGYKFATNQIIYLLNPCHVLTASMIFLLAVDENRKSPFVQAVFRVQLHLLSGPLLAILLPVVNTRHLSCEIESYWLHHCLLYLVPIYLISLGGSYSCEPLTDLWWPVLSVGVGFLYHFTFLQGLALTTKVNLNNMLCPAVSDPFRGSSYRMWAFAHQHFLIAIHGKLYHAFSWLVISSCRNCHSFCCTVLHKNHHDATTNNIKKID